MKSSIINIILVICLIVIAVLLTILIMSRYSHTNAVSSASSASTANSIKQASQQQQLLPIKGQYIAESPYYYDSGYWLDPWYWWYGDNYYRRNKQVYNNNIHTVNNYSNGHGNAINPTHDKPNHTSMPIVQPTLGQITPNITDRLSRQQLIAPSEDSIFPLPTLSSQINILPEQVQLVSDLPVYAPSAPQMPVEMPNHNLPRNVTVNNISTMPMPMPDNIS
jgi:hypothetical protein